MFDVCSFAVWSFPSSFRDLCSCIIRSHQCSQGSPGQRQPGLSPTRMDLGHCTWVPVATDWGTAQPDLGDRRAGGTSNCTEQGILNHRTNSPSPQQCWSLSLCSDWGTLEERWACRNNYNSVSFCRISVFWNGENFCLIIWQQENPI